MNKFYKYWIPTFVGMGVLNSEWVYLIKHSGEDLFVLPTGGQVWKRDDNG